MRLGLALVLVAAAGCGASSGEPGGAAEPPDGARPAPIEVSLPSVPGEFAPSLARFAPPAPGDHARIDGDLLADIDTCATCHEDVARQWQSSIHSFASFGNPIYRTNVELARRELGKPASQHCGGCHDAPLEIDGAMKDEIAADDLRAHTGVACRVCHAIRSTTTDGNGSYVLTREPLPTPDVDDPDAVARHVAAVSVTKLGNELCVGCHRGFLSPDLGVPVHILGLDEPTAWRSSAYTGNGMGRVDQVEAKGCIDCHMPEVAAGPQEYAAASDGKVRAHYFPGGHTWMASMRDDPEQLERIRAMLVGAASIDVAGAIVERDAGGTGPDTVAGRWHLPADGAPIVPGQRVLLDVVVRNRLVGHRFPGGVNDMQDTWIELEARDARGRRVASSGLAHERDAADEDAHVLRSYPVGAEGATLDEHELPSFRAVISNQTIAARDVSVVRYALDVPERVALPLEIRARLRHRSRSLAVQGAVCKETRTKLGAEFLVQARGLRDMKVHPCKPQPITEVASTRVWLGTGWEAATARAGAAARASDGGAPGAAWERDYEHGMALIKVVTERLDEARQVLEHALAGLPDAASDTPATAKARAAVLTQLASVAGRQGRTDDALALVARARALLGGKGPAVLDAVAADALARVWRWEEARPFAQAAADKAPGNTAAWVMLARVLGSLADDRAALDAARRGLELWPRSPDLLRSQATAVAELAPGSDLAAQALAAYDRFRAPDDTAALRIACAARSDHCARERESGHVHVMK